MKTNKTFLAALAVIFGLYVVGPTVAAVSSWSTTPSSNATADAANGINFSEGQAPSSLNDSIRSMMAEIRKWYDQINGVRNRAYVEYATYSGVTQIIPTDDTIPQNTEGVQILSASITPTATTSRLRITVSGNAAATSINGALVTVATFSGASSSALDAQPIYSANGQLSKYSHTFEYAPSTTSAVTISVRIGTNNASNPFAINGTAARIYGGVVKWTLIIEEVPA